MRRGRNCFSAKRKANKPNMQADEGELCCWFDLLPAEIVVAIFIECDFFTLRAIKLVCSSWHALANDVVVWRSAMKSVPDLAVNVSAFMSTIENLRTSEMVEWYLLGYMGYLINYGQGNKSAVKVDDDKLEFVGSTLSATVQKNAKLDRELIPSILFKWLAGTSVTVHLHNSEKEKSELKIKLPEGVRMRIVTSILLGLWRSQYLHIDRRWLDVVQKILPSDIPETCGAEVFGQCVECLKYLMTLLMHLCSNVNFPPDVLLLAIEPVCRIIPSRPELLGEDIWQDERLVRQMGSMTRLKQSLGQEEEQKAKNPSLTTASLRPHWFH